jgi:hypothetical protein
LHIEEVPWTIFSTLGDALETEFYEEFWQVVNYRRKVKKEFLDVTWIDTDYAYDVSQAYQDIRMSIFDRHGCTVKVVCPFKYNDTYLRVHPNAAAVYSDNKKFEFLLQLIVLSHDLLPPLPLFWAQ